MQASLVYSNRLKYGLGAMASLMLTFVLAGCSASGPFQSHSAFKQSVLPSGYQSQPGFGAQNSFGSQSRSANYAPAGYGFGGQAAFSQNSQGFAGGLVSPFAAGSHTSGSC